MSKTVHIYHHNGSGGGCLGIIIVNLYYCYDCEWRLLMKKDF